MENKKVLITGANGYIGKHVTNYFLNNTDYQVLTLDISPALNENVSKHYQLDFLNNSDDKDLFEKLDKPDIIIHLAWKDGFNHNSNEHLKNLNLHYQFIKNMIDSNCQSISIMGSMHEIGYFEGEVNSNTPSNPLSLYGISKNALRQAVLSYCENKKTLIKWLRAFYITGDDKNNKSIFSKILEMEKENKTTFPFTDGLNKYDFIDVEKLAEQISLASIQDKYNGIINVCSGKPISLKEKVEEFIKNKKLNIHPEYGVYPTRKYDSPCIFGNSETINKILESSEYEKNN